MAKPLFLEAYSKAHDEITRQIVNGDTTFWKWVQTLTPFHISKIPLVLETPVTTGGRLVGFIDILAWTSQFENPSAFLKEKKFIPIIIEVKSVGAKLGNDIRQIKTYAKFLEKPTTISKTHWECQHCGLETMTWPEEKLEPPEHCICGRRNFKHLIDEAHYYGRKPQELEPILILVSTSNDYIKELKGQGIHSYIWKGEANE